MKKIIIALTLIFCTFQVSFAQMDTKTKNKIKVKYFSATDSFEKRKYKETIEKINEIEGLMAKAAKLIQSIDEDLGTPAVLGDANKVADLTIKRGKSEKQIADWESEWFDLCTQYEEVTGTNLMED